MHKCSEQHIHIWTCSPEEYNWICAILKHYGPSCNRKTINMSGIIWVQRNVHVTQSEYFHTKKKINCKYSGILRMTWTSKCLLPTPICKWQHVAGSLLWMHKCRYQLQITTDCFLLPLPSSCSVQPPLLSPTACQLRSKNILQKRTAISTAALNARVDGQLHRFPYSLAG